MYRSFSVVAIRVGSVQRTSVASDGIPCAREREREREGLRFGVYGVIAYFCVCRVCVVCLGVLECVA